MKKVEQVVEVLTDTYATFESKSEALSALMVIGMLREQHIASALLLQADLLLKFAEVCAEEADDRGVERFQARAQAMQDAADTLMTVQGLKEVGG